MKQYTTLYSILSVTEATRLTHCRRLCIAPKSDGLWTSHSAGTSGHWRSLEVLGDHLHQAGSLQYHHRLSRHQRPPLRPPVEMYTEQVHWYRWHVTRVWLQWTKVCSATVLPASLQTCWQNSLQRKTGFKYSSFSKKNLTSSTAADTVCNINCNIFNTIITVHLSDRSGETCRQSSFKISWGNV